MDNEVVNIYEGQKSKDVSATTQMMVSRQAQEVQAAMVVAKRFPRDEVSSYGRIMRACERKSLAEQAMYEYTRRGQKITGPSIRLAETLAQNWGNIDFGIVELEQKNGKSQVMSYAWDLETNTRQTKIFEVPHVRKSGKSTYALTDPRDIYEMVANQGTRRLRACILGVIPGDVIESAVEQCKNTLVSGNAEPLIDRVRKMAKVFSDEYSITLEMLEKYLQCKSDAFSEQDFIRLRNIYRSLRDGMSKREDYFEIPKPKDDSNLDNPFEKEGEKTNETDGK